MFIFSGLIGMIRDNGYASADEQYFMHVNVNNDGEDYLEDLSVKLLIYDLGIVLQTESFDLDDGDKEGKLIFWDVPSYVKPGDYLVRITAGNDEARDVKHRVIMVV
ncbi:hypothetical protein KY347_01505 [Candidatus Woesearchaeota archaeon]|nr:hypothetical protein [Candidatus Woesearchaeota archaeon]